MNAGGGESRPSIAQALRGETKSGTFFRRIGFSMALTSTLYTGLSGLDINQQRLNVVGNNIANVNTVSFKSSRVLFKSQFYVTDSGGSAPSGESGGANPSQRGLGAVVAAIQKNFQPGAIEATGRASDMAIDGDGFFVVKSNAQKYTRDGSFILNSANELVTTGGDFVQGFGVDANYNVIPGALVNMVIPMGTATSAQQTKAVTLEGNLNSNGVVANGASILNSQLLTVVGGGVAPDANTALVNVAATATPGVALFTAGETFDLSGVKGGRDLPAASFTVTPTSTLGDLMGFYQQGLGIDSAVPLNPAAPTAGAVVESDATDPTSARIVIVGNTGTENALALPANAFRTVAGNSPFTFADGNNAAGFTSDPTGESVHTSFVAYDSLGTPITVGLTAVLESKANTGNTWRFFVQSPDDTDTDLALGNGTLTFDNSGKMIASTGTSMNVDRANTGATTPMTISLDFNSMTSLTSRDSELVMTEQDGSPIGSLTDYSVGVDGMITGSFSNGLTRTLGKVALATFNNPQGLTDMGGGMYKTSSNSGVPIVSGPLTLGAGAIKSGALEMSNVDLSEEFINLIIASTGFSASSRVITTSDQLITELLNTTR